MVLRSVDEVAKPLEQRLEIAPGEANQRVQRDFMTGYEGYTYNRSHLRMEVDGAEISRILLEKTRPSGQASAYGEGSYIDATGAASASNPASDMSTYAIPPSVGTKPFAR